MKRSLKYILILSVTMLVCTMAVQASIITNGNFTPSNNSPGPGGFAYADQGVSASPWIFSGTLYNGSGVQSNGSAWHFANAPGSQYSAFLQGTSYVSQTMTNLTAGDYYTVSFYLSDRPGYQLNQVGVIIGGVLNQTDGTVTGTPVTTFNLTTGQNWKDYTVTFQATNTNELLSFAGLTASTGQNYAGDFDAGLADVNVRVPEPAMALLLPFGLLFVSDLRRRFLA